MNSLNGFYNTITITPLVLKKFIEVIDMNKTKAFAK
jgi:hypothetical protein